MNLSMRAALTAAGLAQLLLWGYGCTRRRERVSLSQISSIKRNKLYSRHFCSTHIFAVLIKMKRPGFITSLSSAIKKIRIFRAGVRGFCYGSLDILIKKKGKIAP